MKRKDVILLLLSGILIWIAGTLIYGLRGPQFFETTRMRYWLVFAASSLLSALLCVAILWRRQIPSGAWTTGTLLLVIPGMIGEAVALSHLSFFMPKLHAASAGRYGTFLFATYAVVLGVVEFITLRAQRATS